MNKKVLALFLTAILLSGCSRDHAPNDSAVLSPTATSKTGSDTSSEPSDSSESASISETESTLTSETSGIPKELSDYIGSLDNGDFVFVDYTFDEDREFIESVTNWNNPWSMTIGALMETDDYKKFAADFADAEAFGRFTDKPEDFLDRDGNPMPLYKGTITDDFDNDGMDENFVLTAIAKIPDDSEEQRWHEREYLFFVDENGAVLLDDYYDAKVKAVLDYGCCKQLIVDSSGWSGNDSKSAIWGVKDGKAVNLYGGRLTYQKNGCFLYSSGPQSIGDFAVYDIGKGEYLAIQGKPLNTDDVLAMGDLPEDYRSRLKEGWSVTLLGGKFYLISDGYFEGKQFIYEDGKFTESSELVRLSLTPGLTGKALGTLDDVNYDAALASMIKPEDNKDNTIAAANSDWEKITLVDYTLEQDPQSAVAEDAAEYIAKAEEELLKCDMYKQSAEYFTPDILSDEKPLVEAPERFFGEDGKFRPIFKCAFVDDFDNDGTEEAFVALGMPTPEFTGERTFLFLVNADGAEPVPKEQSHFHGDDTFYMLDYGCCKQLAIATGGDIGADFRSAIIGVSDGKAYVHFAHRSGVLKKYGPFLTIDIGAQGAAYYGFFDAKTKKYYTTLGKQLTLDEIKEMDTSDSISASGEFAGNFTEFYVIGGKYYYFIGMMGLNALFTYEDGIFTKLDSNEYAFRPSVDRDTFTEIADIDYDKAMSSAIAVEDAKNL